MNYRYSVSEAVGNRETCYCPLLNRGLSGPWPLLKWCVWNPSHRNKYPIVSSFGSQTTSEPVMLGDFSRVGLTNRTKCGLGCFQMSSRGCKKKLRSFTCSPAVSSGTVLAGMIAWGPCAPGRQNKTVSTSHGRQSANRYRISN